MGGSSGDPLCNLVLSSLNVAVAHLNSNEECTLDSHHTTDALCVKIPPLENTHAFYLWKAYPPKSEREREREKREEREREREEREREVERGRERERKRS